MRIMWTQQDEEATVVSLLRHPKEELICANSDPGEKSIEVVRMAAV